MKTLTQQDLLRYALVGLEAELKEVDARMALVRSQIKITAAQEYAGGWVRLAKAELKRRPGRPAKADLDLLGELPLPVKRRGRAPGYHVSAASRHKMAVAQRRRYRQERILGKKG